MNHLSPRNRIHRRQRWLLGSLLLAGFALAALTPVARAQDARPCGPILGAAPATVSGERPRLSFSHIPSLGSGSWHWF